MAAKKIGISRDLIIHPGETIADVLEERGITQSELASSAGVSPAYVSSVIEGMLGISPNCARGLEYAIGVPKSFWLNLQANSEAELLEANELQTITEEERIVREDLKEIVKEEDIQFLAESAYADACAPGNPKDASVEDIIGLYKSLL